MNIAILAGFVVDNPIIKTFKQKFRVAEFKIIIPREEKAKYTAGANIFVCCKAFDDWADFAFSYLNRGVLVAITGVVEWNSTQNCNYIKVVQMEALTKKQIAIENFDEFIEKYSSTTYAAKKVAKKKHEEEEKNGL